MQSKSRPEYDYSRLGDTWSSPRIIRIPNDGRDLNDEDDVYVAIMEEASRCCCRSWI